jgi:hypothetical protein
MGDEQRQRVRAPATFVDHVHAQAVNRHREVRQTVEPRLLPPQSKSVRQSLHAHLAGNRAEFAVRGA